MDKTSFNDKFFEWYYMYLTALTKENYFNMSWYIPIIFNCGFTIWIVLPNAAYNSFTFLDSWSGSGNHCPTRPTSAGHCHTSDYSASTNTGCEQCCSSSRWNSNCPTDCSTKRWNPTVSNTANESTNATNKSTDDRWTSISTIGYPGSTHSSYICTNYAASPEPRSRTAK